jgi:hypothetical protein
MLDSDRTAAWLMQTEIENSADRLVAEIRVNEPFRSTFT